jgi:hypothetical protein
MADGAISKHVGQIENDTSRSGIAKEQTASTRRMAKLISCGSQWGHKPRSEPPVRRLFDHFSFKVLKP